MNNMETLLKLIQHAKGEAIKLQCYQVASILRDAEKEIEIEKPIPLKVQFRTMEDFERTIIDLYEHDITTYNKFVKRLNG